MLRHAALLLGIFIFLSLQAAVGYSQTDTSRVHELTVFVVPSLYELDWSSPSTLFVTTFKSISIAMFRKNAYSIGHMFIELSTPLLDSVVLTSIRSSRGPEKRKLVLNEKIGLGILGAYLTGQMETRKELTKRIVHFSSEKKLTFIKFRLSETSAERVVDYIRKFTSKGENGHAPCEFYGGAFWPRFENEGAGCTSFGVAAMEVAGLDINHPEWMVSVNIPMALVGGEYNSHNKVSRKSICKARYWHSGDGIENVDYIFFSIYDPSLIYNWIQSQRAIIEANSKSTTPDNTTAGGFILYQIKNFPGCKKSIPGLYFDARNVIVSKDVPLFIKRNRSSVFIDTFLDHLK